MLHHLDPYTHDVLSTLDRERREQRHARLAALGPVAPRRQARRAAAALLRRAADRLEPAGGGAPRPAPLPREGSRVC
jgi:hypothetical protein